MFDAVAPVYDLVNRIVSFGVDGRWRRAAVRALAADGGRPRHVLDVATGTADLAIAAARAYAGSRVVGVDPSAVMLAKGREKVARARLEGRVALAEGDARALAFPDDTFDAAAIAFGIRNVPDRPRALAEMRRVVRPGGRVVVLELGEPTGGITGFFARLHVHRVIPGVGHLFARGRAYRYLAKSIEAFPSPPAFAASMVEAGIEVREVRPFAFGACVLFVGESRP
jgi:demethylmenaquinone methyltransferase/2-methoxy-6-polyprenyl-1,4-benzoquinol methylase